MPCRLTLHYQDAPSQQFFLFEGRHYQLGRDAQSDIQINAASVSREHALCYAEKGNWNLVDQGSLNGCLVAGQRQQKIAIRAPLKVLVGDILCLFEPISHQGIVHYEQALSWRQAQQPDISMLTQTSDIEDLLQLVREHLMHMLGCDRAAVIYLDEQQQLEQCVGYPAWLAKDSFSGSKTVIKRVAESGQALVLANLQTDQDLAARASVLRANIQAVLCYPVPVNRQVRAVLYADSNMAQRCFSEADVALCEALAEQLGIALSLQALDHALLQIGSSLQMNHCF
ncbi:cofactor assembly of complex C subunit B [Aliiglaciecola sp. CAU 1673]|uniref:cofactor assembly of complex C subunit B n=1 Tax=Aliiglaciecola sp. CAU 1673 TaxID=3032595 RepID=UPI0023D9A9A0|nr:cofactor assembly of complex C subunit B [Aliiglaciecola sp. CAU 1673]MDF2178157.1 cofactor assembly of complex C subunit B [Aliiglaciecola sp. CAU 1673]